MAEFALRARGMQLVNYEEGKDPRPGKEYMKRPLLGKEEQWTLIWYDEEEG